MMYTSLWKLCSAWFYCYGRVKAFICHSGGLREITSNIQFPRALGFTEVCVCAPFLSTCVLPGTEQQQQNRRNQWLCPHERRGGARAFIRSQRWIRWNYSRGSKPGSFLGDVVRTHQIFEPRVTWSSSFCLMLRPYSNSICITERGRII